MSRKRTGRTRQETVLESHPEHNGHANTLCEKEEGLHTRVILPYSCGLDMERTSPSPYRHLWLFIHTVYDTLSFSPSPSHQIFTVGPIKHSPPQRCYVYLQSANHPPASVLEAHQNEHTHTVCLHGLPCGSLERRCVRRRRRRQRKK